MLPEPSTQLDPAEARTLIDRERAVLAECDLGDGAAASRAGDALADIADALLAALADAQTVAENYRKLWGHAVTERGNEPRDPEKDGAESEFWRTMSGLKRRFAAERNAALAEVDRLCQERDDLSNMLDQTMAARDRYKRERNAAYDENRQRRLVVDANMLRIDGLLDERDAATDRAERAEAESRLLRDELRALADAVEAYMNDEAADSGCTLRSLDLAERSARTTLYDSAGALGGDTE